MADGSELEALALAAQGGDGEALAELWARVASVSAWQARQFSGLAARDQAVDADDLQQEAAEAFLLCVRRWQPEIGCTFLTALKNQIRWRLLRRSAAAADLPVTVSLETPLAAGDGDDLTLADTLADELAELPIEQTAERTDLAAAVADLPERQRDVIRLRYYREMPIEAVAVRTGLPVQDVRQADRKALATLRRDRRLRSYRDEWAASWRHVGLSEFRTTFTSAVEAAVIRRDEMWSKDIKE